MDFSNLSPEELQQLLSEAYGMSNTQQDIEDARRSAMAAQLRGYQGGGFWGGFMSGLTPGMSGAVSRHLRKGQQPGANNMMALYSKMLGHAAPAAGGADLAGLYGGASALPGSLGAADILGADAAGAGAAGAAGAAGGASLADLLPLAMMA